MKRCCALLMLLSVGICAMAQMPMGARVSRGMPQDSTATDSTAQQGIVYNTKEPSTEELAAMVNIFHYWPGRVKIAAVSHPNIAPAGMPRFDTLESPLSYYLGRGYGLVHYALLSQEESTLHFRYQADANPAYSRTFHNLRMYQTLKPYTVLSYNSDIHSNFRVHATHTQNITPRWNAAVNADFLIHEGIYTRSDARDRLFDVTTHYHSANARYHLQGGLYRQNLYQEENGGVADDSLCWQQSVRSGVPVQLYAAANRWRSTGVFLHQSYNTVRQMAEIKARRDSISLRDSLIDTLPPHPTTPFNSGVVALDLSYQKQKRNYYDTQTDHFENHFIDSTYTYDSTATHLLSARLYWTNDAYANHHWHNPWKITVGVTPEILWAPAPRTEGIADFDTYSGPIAQHLQCHASLTPFLSNEWHLHRTTLSVEGDMVAGSYRHGDHLLRLHLSSPLSPHTSVELHARSQATMPDLYYYQYAGNNARWLYPEDYYSRQQQQRIEAALHLQPAREHLPAGTLSIAMDRRSHMLFLQDDAAHPFLQNPDAATLLQATLHTTWSGRLLHCDMTHLLQHSDRDDLFSVPLYAGKGVFYIDAPLFKNALRLQFGITLSYFTTFYAQAWEPYYGIFVPQHSTTIGNSLWCDLFVSAQIKRVNFYIKTTHWNALLASNPHYFTLPHYPGDDLNVQWGITWHFFD